MTLKKKSWISVVLFVVIFGALLITATFTDLQVSTILTKNALEPGKYLTSDPFGASFEAFGSDPVYMLAAFAFAVLFWYVVRNFKDGALKWVLEIVTAVCSTVANYILCSDTFGYILEHAEVLEVKDEMYYTLTLIFFAVVITVPLIFATKLIDKETNKKLLNFAFAAICIVAIANIFIAVIKGPVGRMRYRAMNCEGGQKIGGFDNFTRWYVVNGKNHGYSKEELVAIFGTSDACRSFPSGHTNAAGMSYAFIMLIDALDIKNKRKKMLIWLIPIIITGTVAVSRIIVGAHYFSDVLVGGTTAFVSMILCREIFICKFSHLKAMFSK